jgi:hypothetical protein
MLRPKPPRIHPRIQRRHASGAALTLLHKTRAFVPRALPPSAPWADVLSAAQAKLSVPARPRIVGAQTAARKYE